MPGVGYNQMERLIMLGRGNALVTRCYNTCFALRNNNEYFLVDAGGGNGILAQLEKAEINYKNIKGMFVTHGHTDHIIGAIWIIRKYASLTNEGKYRRTFSNGKYIDYDVDPNLIEITKASYSFPDEVKKGFSR